jgi:deoxycytidylate deaminase
MFQFQEKNARDIVALDHRMMMHAVIASWASVDPYCQSGAVLADKEEIRAMAFTYPIGDVPTYAANPFKLSWDNPKIYDFIVPAEIKVLRALSDKETNFFAFSLYITTIPHPDSVVNILDRGIRRIVYAPKKPYGLPKDYKKTFEFLSKSYHSVKIERYGGNLHWVKDKIGIMELQVPELFS